MMIGNDDGAMVVITLVTVNMDEDNDGNDCCHEQ